MKERMPEEEIYDACRRILNGASDEIALTAIFLLVQTRRILDRKKNGAGDDRIYDLMLEQAALQKMVNPFSTMTDFIYAYRMLEDIGPVDLEGLLAMEYSKTSGSMHIPPEIFKMMEANFQPDTEKVLVTEGQKFAPFLKRTVNTYSHCRFVITVQEPIYAAILQDVFQDSPNVVIEQTSIYKYEFLQQKFDLILSLPSFGTRNMVDENTEFICREYEMVAMENLLLHLSSNGRLAIIMPAKITFAGARVKALRNFIQEMYSLEEISELPGGVFSKTGIKTYFLRIATGHTDDVTIKKYDFDDRKHNAHEETRREMILRDESFVVLSELAEQGDWNLDKLFARQDEEWNRFMERGSRIRLREVAQVFRGKNNSRKSDTGNVGVINISQLRDYDIDYGGLEYINGTERNIANYFLEDGDVLLPARGTATRVAIFEKQDFPCIASSNIIIIRPRQDLLSGVYLKMFLDSPLGGKILASAQQGTTVVNLSYRDLQEIEIPFLPLETQKELADEYKKELKIYTEAVNAAENRWKTALEKLQAML